VRDTLLQQADCRWLDVVNPSPDDLRQLAHDYAIHPVLLADCLDPEHLPKYEASGSCVFVIIRAYDVAAPVESFTVQQLTRKLVLVLLEGKLLTIHRTPLPFLSQYAQGLAAQPRPLTPSRLFYEICKEAMVTYDQAFLGFENRLEALEEAAVSGAKAGTGVLEIFLQVRQEARRLSTIKRLLWHSSAIFQRLPPLHENEKIYAHDLQETVHSLMFFADELADDAHTLGNLELSLNAHRNNQVIRVLTLFSVFFMPLTFIVGVYGMNFEHMPELHSPHGYGVVWLVMVAIALGIAFWFKKRQWFND
jgi:magnesium transporter